MPQIDLLVLAVLLWFGGALLALSNRLPGLVRIALAAGGAVALLAALMSLPGGTPTYTLPMHIIGDEIRFRLAPEALWLMGFGLVPAILACALGTPSPRGRSGWLFGAALSLLGALGVFGLQNGAAFLISWELMSLGGATMILSERLASAPGRGVLFMLALLEIGAVALILAILLLGDSTRTLSFEAFGDANLAAGAQIVVGLLLILGFGAKIGLLPFYEWFPGAYGSGSGASGSIISGVVMNAAFFGLQRGLVEWLPPQTASMAGLAIFLVTLGVLSAILTGLYAFQEDDWRTLLSFSSAENASIAVAALGAALMFRANGLPNLAGLAWTVSLLHLAGHALAKGGLFLTADGLFGATGGYTIRHAAARGSWLFGVGALFAGMSLAAMPPQAGFVSEWFVFQTMFQGFHLPTLAGRLVLALAGAGIALTAALAFATIVKVLGIGLFGQKAASTDPIPRRYTTVVALLGACVLALAAGMPVWLAALDLATSSHFGSAVARQMHQGPLLVPLTATFAFISPSLLVVVMPLLALLPLGLLFANRRFAVRRTPVWYGGLTPNEDRAVTTALTFSNAMRTFYSFVYRPTMETEHEADQRGYFIRRLKFEHDVAPIFGPILFVPAVRTVRFAAARLRMLQSGHVNVYLGLIGLLLVVVLALVLI